MKRKTVGVLFGCVAIAVLPTAALSASGGKQLSAWCNSRQQQGSRARNDQRHLMGYVQGATDALIDHDEACPPDSATVGHGVDILCRYVAQNPQRWSSSKFALTRDAFAKAYPCARR